MPTFAQFLETHAITMRAKYLGLDVETLADKPWHSFKWECTFTRGRSTLTATYRMGLAHCKRVTAGAGLAHLRPLRTSAPREAVTQEIASALSRGGRVTVSDLEGFVRPATPEAAQVLQSLASDANSAINADTFESFAEEFGYDTDSRRAESVYNACKEEHFKLTRWLGAALCAELLECTEEEEA